jgi:CRP/FNR family transcriptional regulator, cyclic AMP receptor protein
LRPVTQPGAVFGEISILLGVPHTASVRAVRPTRAYVVEDGRAFLKSKPEVLLYVGKLLATRLQAATAYLADIKRQFAEHGDHLCMVDEVLDSILQHQDTEFTPGSEREPDCPH